MPKFEGENLEVLINPILQENEHLHILVTHDETTFHSNDGRQSGWAPHGNSLFVRKEKVKPFMLVIFYVKQLDDCN